MTWCETTQPCVFYIYIIYTYSRYCCSHAHDWTGFQKIGFHSQGWPIFRQDLCPGFVLNDPPRHHGLVGDLHISMYVYKCDYVYICIICMCIICIYICVCTCIYIILYIILRTIEEVFYLTGKKQKISFMFSHR